MTEGQSRHVRALTAANRVVEFLGSQAEIHEASTGSIYVTIPMGPYQIRSAIVRFADHRPWMGDSEYVDFGAPLTADEMFDEAIRQIVLVH